MPPSEQSRRSYTSHGRVTSFFRDGIRLLRSHYEGGVERHVAEIVAQLRELERLLEVTYGFRLENKRVLDLGAGQRLNQLAYFALRGNAVGIDADVIVQGFDPVGYLRMLRLNGGRRTLKTVARKLMLVDHNYRRELARQLGVRRIPQLDARQMDATELSFADASFDLVYSQSVFSHLSDPTPVLVEMKRVLVPGGVVFVDFLIFTALTGCMDVRMLGGGRDAGLPVWAHLRPAHQAEVQESAYLNKLRLPEWRAIFDSAMPGARIVLHQPERALLEPEAVSLQQSGELADYELDELTTSHMTVLWQKPLLDQDAAASSSETVTNT